MNGQTPKQWTRNALWRQGHALRSGATAALGLKNAIDESATLVVVISHDCDLATDDLDVEPDVEVVLIRLTHPPSEKPHLRPNS